MRTLMIFTLMLVIWKAALPQGFIIDNTSTLHDLHTFETSRMNALEINRYLHIAGSPFLSDDFYDGEVVINDSIRYEKVPLRYNIYTDKMEFLDAQHRILEVNTSNHQFTFEFDTKLFRLVHFNDGKSIKPGLLEVLVDGKTKLYRKYNIVITAGSPPMGYQAAKPTKFTRKPDQFYLATDDQIPVLITSKRNLVRKLEQVNPAISQYAKNNRLQTKSAQSLIGIVKYANNPID